jgi:hypothetical protein
MLVLENSLFLHKCFTFQTGLDINSFASTIPLSLTLLRAEDDVDFLEF